MVYLKQLSNNDGNDIFLMLKGIQPVEHSFTNPVCNMSYMQFKDWLCEQSKWADGKELPDGYVPQVIYWLYDDDQPVGIGKIRMELTPESRYCGGNIGYAISRDYRGLGYGKRILELLLVEAKRLKLDVILLTVDRDNYYSKRVCEENGGVLVDSNPERWYYKF